MFVFIYVSHYETMKLKVDRSVGLVISVGRHGFPLGSGLVGL